MGSLADLQREQQRQEEERFYTEDIAMFGKPWAKLTFVEKGTLFLAHVDPSNIYFNPGDITAGAAFVFANVIFHEGALVRARRDVGLANAVVARIEKAESWQKYVGANYRSYDGKSLNHAARVMRDKMKQAAELPFIPSQDSIARYVSELREEPEKHGMT